MDIEFIPAKPKEQKITRVAAYARVSSEKDAAFHSLEAQTEYYEKYILQHPGWELVGIYSDNAISGTTIERREFQRMLEDCRSRKIDLVVTKSVTRFARNTVILLETIRELKALDIDCYFEKENMHSISPDGELLLTLLAMYAEEEARSASENQKWRIQKLYDQGKPAGGNVYGYRLENNKFVIVPEEAKVVKMIYEMYLSGMGYTKIARTLKERGIPSRFGSWCYSSVRNVLQSEKYVGDIILQKYFVEDFRTKKSRKNTGEMRRVFVRNSHEAIIDRETHEAVQLEIARRAREVQNIVAQSNVVHDERDKIFKGLITCGICGSAYIHKYSHKAKKTYKYWICLDFNRYGKSVCSSQKIPDDILIEKTCEVLGVSELSRNLIMEKISRIIVPAHNLLVYELRDGSKQEVTWEFRSRSLSWTDEMKQAARERSKKRGAKAKGKDEE